MPVNIPHKFTEYAEDCLAGRVVVGEYVKLAARRYLDMFSNPDYYFDQEAAERPVKFAHHLKHFTGKFAGKHFDYLPWQKFFIYGVFGFKHKSDHTRVVRNVYLQIARKNGKTALIAAICLYLLICDKEPNASIMIGSPTRDQSKICYEMCTNFAYSINDKNFLKIMRNGVEFPSNMGRITTISSEAKSGDGYNISTGLIDEFHAMPDSALYDVMVSSMGMRTQPMMVMITTAGFDLSSQCKTVHDTCVDILHNIKKDDSFFALIYEIDQNDDWQNPDVWCKSNPSLDVTVTSSYLENQILQAKNNPSLETSVKTKNLNLWCQSAEVWIPDDKIYSLMEPLTLEKIKDYGCEYCYVGVDLAAVSDFTSLSIIATNGEKYFAKTFTYLPTDSLTTHYNRELYRQWANAGFLIKTPGNVTDYDYIIKDMKKINEILPIQTVYYDSYNATQWAISATEQGFPLEPYSQSLSSFNAPTREMERLLLSNKIIMDKNPITAYCFRNVTLKEDYNGNVKPIKSAGNKAAVKIDNVISMIQALAACIKNEGFFETFNLKE